MTARDFLVRGLLAGLLAGFIAFGVAHVVGEPSVKAAIAVEEAQSAAAPAEEGHSHEGEGHPAEEAASADDVGHSHGEGTEVPRDLQSTVGLLTATLVFGTTLGGLVGIGSGMAMGRFGRASARATTLGVAAGGFVVAYVVPFLIYPPNPPAVGSGETIGERTALYFTLLGISLAVAGAAVYTGRRLLPRLGGWHASLLSGGVYLVVMVAVLALMPHYNEVGADFPAATLYEFRLGSLLTQAALWGAIGLLMAEFVQRMLVREGAVPKEPERAPAAV